MQDPNNKQTECGRAERTAAANLDGEDEHTTTSHHVEEEDHSFILMRRVGVEYPLGHHVTLIDAQHRRQQLISVLPEFNPWTLSPLMFPHECLFNNEYMWRSMDTASHGGTDEADKRKGEEQEKLTVAWLRTITWIPLPCSRMSSSNTCRVKCISLNI